MTKYRDFNGYQQYRYGRNWQFEVVSFDSTTSGEAGFCYVLKTDGSKEQIPIDEKDRITILGKKYSRANWHH